MISKVKNNESFCCPDCGGKIVYWEEVTCIKIKEIDFIEKKIYEYKDGYYDEEKNDLVGIKCLKCNRIAMFDNQANKSKIRYSKFKKDVQTITDRYIEIINIQEKKEK